MRGIGFQPVSSALKHLETYPTGFPIVAESDLHQPIRASGDLFRVAAKIR